MYPTAAPFVEGDMYGSQSGRMQTRDLPLQQRPAFQSEADRRCKRPRHTGAPSRKPPATAAAAAPATYTAPEASSTATQLRGSELQLRPLGDESQLPAYDTSQGKVHLAVVGAGPSGLSVAERVAAAGFRVCIIDPSPLAPWTNNYGVWKDEFEAIGLEDCLSTVWNQAHVFLDSTPGGKR